MSDFKKGDVVVLKSGGPNMTVTDVVAEFRTGLPLAKCSWFDASNELKHENFLVETIKKIEE
ncbi:DUF2158 domain-containing protein [Pseudomonas sp. Ap32]|nr:DUF2158 domain-containing protein [Pseudomonas sp. Ap32]